MNRVSTKPGEDSGRKRPRLNADVRCLNGQLSQFTQGGEMAQMFVNAIGYEQLMGRWSIRLAPLYVNFAKLRDEGRVLDVGCGTGALVKVVGGMTRQAEIVGVDPAQSFVDYARSQISNARIKLEVGDAMQLPFPTASFHQTLSLLVMMFIPEPEKAAREMKRVTRPGGTVSACTWDRDGWSWHRSFGRKQSGSIPVRTHVPRGLSIPTARASSPLFGSPPV
jgi:SAM-dependent methyltransferase